MILINDEISTDGLINEIASAIIAYTHSTLSNACNGVFGHLDEIQSFIRLTVILR